MVEYSMNHESPQQIYHKGKVYLVASGWHDMPSWLSYMSQNSNLRHVDIAIQNVGVRELSEILAQNQEILSVSCDLYLGLDDGLPCDPRLVKIRVRYCDYFASFGREMRYAREMNTRLLCLDLDLKGLQSLSLDLKGMQHLKFDMPKVKTCLLTHPTLRKLHLANVADNAITKCFLRVMRYNTTIQKLKLHGDLPVRMIRYLVATTQSIERLDCEFSIKKRRKRRGINQPNVTVVIHDIMQSLVYNTSIETFCFRCSRFEYYYYNMDVDFEMLKWNSNLKHIYLYLSHPKYHRDVMLSVTNYWTTNLMHNLMWNHTLRSCNLLNITCRRNNNQSITSFLIHNQSIRRLKIETCTLMFESEPVQFLISALNRHTI